MLLELVVVIQVLPLVLLLLAEVAEVLILVMLYLEALVAEELKVAGQVVQVHQVKDMLEELVMKLVTQVVVAEVLDRLGIIGMLTVVQAETVCKMHFALVQMFTMLEVALVERVELQLMVAVVHKELMEPLILVEAEHLMLPLIMKQQMVAQVSLLYDTHNRE